MSQPRLDLVPGGGRIALLPQPANRDKQMVAAATARRVRWDQQLTSCDCRLLESGLLSSGTNLVSLCTLSLVWPASKRGWRAASLLYRLPHATLNPCIGNRT